MADSDTLVDIILPDLGTVEARVSVWFARPGDRVFAGERVLELIADGATFDVAAPVSGELALQLAFPREPLTRGQTLGRVRADEE